MRLRNIFQINNRK